MNSYSRANVKSFWGFFSLLFLGWCNVISKYHVPVKKSILNKSNGVATFSSPWSDPFSSGKIGLIGSTLRSIHWIMIHINKSFRRWHSILTLIIHSSFLHRGQRRKEEVFFVFSKKKDYSVVNSHIRRILRFK